MMIGVADELREENAAEASREAGRKEVVELQRQLVEITTAAEGSLAEVDISRRQVRAAEAQRDEALRLAERVQVDLDEANKMVEAEQQGRIQAGDTKCLACTIS